MKLAEATKIIIDEKQLDLGMSKSLADKYPPIVYLEFPEILQESLNVAFPFVKKETIELLSQTINKNPFHPLVSLLDSESWKLTLIYKTLDGTILIDEANEWDECRYLVKHKHKPNTIEGLEVIDIIQRNKSIKFDIRNTCLDRKRDFTQLCDDQDSIENYDSEGYKIDGWKTVVKIDGIGPHDHLYSIIRKALADNGIIAKERFTGCASMPEVKECPEATPSIVVLHVNSNPMPG